MKTSRTQILMPRGIPRWIRCYDNGGTDGFVKVGKQNIPNGISPGTIDRYTVVFTGRWRRPGAHDARCQYLAMNAAPFHPQGFGQHGESYDMIDVNKWGYPPMIGRRNHLGVRIPFKSLPEDCRKFVLQNYKEIWSLK